MAYTYPITFAQDAFTDRDGPLDIADPQDPVDEGKASAPDVCPDDEQCAVTALTVAVADAKSTSFQTSDANVAFAQRMNFAPVDETLTIAWELLNEKNFLDGRLELYRRGETAAIWSRALTAEEMLAKTLAWNGELDEAGDDFPEGILTVEHSPYKLKLTGRGPTQKNRERAWTHFDVLVHEITVHWGSHDILPYERDDIPVSKLDQGPPEAEDLADDIVEGDGNVEDGDAVAVGDAQTEAPVVQGDILGRDAAYRREGKIINALRDGGLSLADAGDHLGDELEVRVDVSLFNKSTEFTAFRDMWGNGPRIPLLARATVERSDGESEVDRPEALGKVGFLWDWCDNEAELDTEGFLENWIDARDANSKVTGINRAFLNKFIEAQRSEHYPKHAFNCPASRGGKRGVAHPKPAEDEFVTWQMHPAPREFRPAPVFLDWDGKGDFPFRASNEPLKHRSWCAISYPNPSAEVEVGEGVTAHTGVLFQPTAIAGDRFKLNVVLAIPEPDGKLCADAAGDVLPTDADRHEDNYLDLPALAAETGVPAIATRTFAVYRAIDCLFWHGSGIQPAPIEQMMNAQYRREMGTVIEFEHTQIPDCRARLDHHRSEVVKQMFNSASTALFVGAPLWRADSVVDNDYVFEVNHTFTVDDDPLRALFREGDLFFLKDDDRLDGKEIVGQNSHARGVVLKRPDVFDHCHVAVQVAGGGPFQVNEAVKTTTETAVNVAGTELSAVTASSWGLVIEPVADAVFSNREIQVEVTDLGGIILYYSGGLIRPSRDLSDEHKVQLNRLCAAIGHHDPANPLRIRVTGKGSDDRERKRASNVGDYLKQHIINREAFHQVFISNAKVAEAARLKKEFVEATNRIARNMLYERVDADRDARHDGRAYYIHYRSATRYGDGDTVTGAYDSGKNDDRAGVYQVSEPANPDPLNLMKSTDSVIVHEFGHALNLAHAAARLPETKNAGGSFDDHLAHDSCLMNYDVDSESFCAVCMLRRRGWAWKQLSVEGWGEYGDVWDAEAERILKEEAEAGNASDATKMRYALFLHSVRNKTGSAKDLMSPIEASVSDNGTNGTGADVWKLRNNIVFNELIEARHRAMDLLEKLRGFTQHPTDMSLLYADGRYRPDHIRGHTIARWYPWKSGAMPEGYHYKIAVTLGDVAELFADDATSEAGRKARLQVLGMMNRPLDHPQVQDCYDFSWQHFKRVIEIADDAAAAAQLDPLISQFLLEGGALPDGDDFARAWLPGGHSVMFAQNYLMGTIPPEQEGQAAAKPFEDYMLGADRFQVENAFNAANAALGKIPLNIQVERKQQQVAAPVGGEDGHAEPGDAPVIDDAQAPGGWEPAPGVRVYLRSAQSNALEEAAEPADNTIDLAGGSAFYNRIAAPALGDEPQKNLKAKVIDFEPTAEAPDANNVHHKLGGRRGAVMYCAPRLDNFATLVPRSGMEEMGPALTTDDAGRAKIVFAPSPIGGDMHRLQIYVERGGGNGGFRDVAAGQPDVYQSGNIVRWRAVRISLNLHMPPATEPGHLPASCRWADDTPATNVSNYLADLPAVDLSGRLSREFAKSYCQLILEPDAQLRRSLGDFGQSIIDEARRLAAAYPKFNRVVGEIQTSPGHMKRIASPYRQPMEAVEGEATHRRFSIVLLAAPTAGELSIRPAGGNFASRIASDETDNTLQALAEHVATIEQIDVNGRHIDLVFSEPKENNQYEVVYYPDAVFDIAKLLDFPDRSPFLFNLKLPSRYNTAKAANFMPMDYDAENESARPDYLHSYIDNRNLGFVKALLMEAAVRGPQGNRGFFPGLVILHAHALDNFTAIWPTGLQEGKAVGNGIYLFGGEDGPAFQRLAVHEISHGLYLEHAPSAPNNRPELHDAGTDICVMSYSDEAVEHCGQCVATLRGVNTSSDDFA